MKKEFLAIQIFVTFGYNYPKGQVPVSYRK